MTVTKTPEVGKIIVKSAPSTSAYPWYVEGGTVSRISGQRAYYKDKDGKEHFTHDPAAVCDTQAEADELLQFSAKEQRAYDEYMAGIKKRDEALWAELAGGKASAKSKDKVVNVVGRRSRTR